MNLLSEKGVDLINKTKTIFLEGKKQDLPAYKIDLNLLNYNIKNGRISSQINEYETKNNIKLINEENADLFELNNLIEKFIINSNKSAFITTKNSIDNFGQHEIGIVLSDGTIIDGNRRFTCLRVLNRENSQKIESLFFEAIILPNDISKKEIKKLELQIQHATEEKVDYDIMDKIMDVYKYIKIDEELTVEEYARNSGWDRSKIIEYIETYELVDDYLDNIGCKGQIYLATYWKLQGPMREIWLVLKKVNDKKEKNNIKNILFTFLKLSKSGDLTREIRDYGKVLLVTFKNNSTEAQNTISKLNELDKKIDEITNNSLSANENLIKVKESKVAREFKECLENLDQNLRFKNDKKMEKQKLERIYEMINSIDIEKISRSSGDVKGEIINICKNIENKTREIKWNAEKPES